MDVSYRGMYFPYAFGQRKGRVMPNSPETDDNLQQAAWRDMLKISELYHVAQLEARSRDLDAERRAISAELTRIRMRCYQRRRAEQAKV